MTRLHRIYDLPTSDGRVIMAELDGVYYVIQWIDGHPDFASLENRDLAKALVADMLKSDIIES